MGLFRFLFSKRKCLVYTAFGHRMYFDAVNRFREHGIPYDTSLRVNANAHSAVAYSDNPQTRNASVDNSQYDFYVEKEYEYRAKQALNS